MTDPAAAWRQFEEELLPTELAYLEDRRHCAGSERDAAPGEGPLVGLALSGGGIRSATFSLGVLQALDRWGVFRHIDYLSTVSGGGFIGAALSAVLANRCYRRAPREGDARSAAPSAAPSAPDSAEPFPFALPVGGRESEELSHLRNHSNYLFAGGLRDALSMLAVLLRGILLNSLALFPFLLMMSLVVVLLYGQQLSDRARFDNQVEGIEGLLGRYFGSEEFADSDADTKPEVEALLEVLEREALLRLDQGRTRFDLIHELRPPLVVEPRERRGLLRRRPEVDDEFITGSGTESNPFRLRPDASLRDVATALLVADALQPNEVIQELDLLARLVESEGYSHCERCVEEWVEILRRRGLIRGATPDEELLAFLTGARGTGRAGPWIVGQGDSLAGYRWQASLKQALYALYAGETLDEEAMGALTAGRLQRRPYYAYGWYAGRVGELFDGGWYLEPPAEDPLRPGFGHFAFPEAISLTGSALRVHEVLLYLAEFGQFEILLPQDLDATGAFYFDDVPWTEAFDAVVAMHGLGYEVEGTTVRVAPLAEMRRRAHAGAAKRPFKEPIRRQIDRSVGEIESLARDLATELRGAEARDLGRILEGLDALAGREASSERQAPGCDAATQSPALRCATTRDDIARLLRFEELTRLDDPFTLQQGVSLGQIVELLYRGEYLDPAFVRARLAAAQSEGERLAAAVVARGFPADCMQLEAPWCSPAVEELLALLEPAPSVMRPDLLRRLTAAGWVLECTGEGAPESPCWQPGTMFAPGAELPAVLARLRPLLDEDWVLAQAYVYDFGWHRRLHGRGYAGTWCASEAARRSLDPQCPAATDESWKALARAVRDPSTWDPDHLTLPFTSILLRVGLGWVLLFPVLLVVGGPLYRRRRREVSAAANPLRRLLTSDESLVWRGRYEKTFGLLLALTLGALVIELLPYAVHHFHYLALRGQSTSSLAIGAVSLVVTLLSGPALAFLDRFGRRVTLVLLSIAGPLLLLTLFVLTTEYVVYAQSGGAADALLGLVPGDLSLWRLEEGRRFLDPVAAGVLWLLVAAGSLVLASLVDINATSLHGLYRDRLSRAFLVGLDTGGTVEPEEDLSLGQICPAGSGAPYHLVNTALNLQGSPDRSLRGRRSDPFCFSRDYVGGQRTGYCRTRDLERLRPELHLGSAMAVSAAAVSPSMGRFTRGPLAVLISLVNARLALWVPNPEAVRGYFGDRQGALGRPHTWLTLAWRRWRLRTPATLLLRELAGRVDSRGPVVNVSDGGHIENMATIELLRRRCRYIVLVDGEADLERSFGGFASLQRFARLDLGIEIDIDLTDLRPDDKGLSAGQSAAGAIHYPATEHHPASRGLLLYFKLGVTGRERATAAEYRAKNPDFPHQSTGDQAFDEAQFEAYRELGYAAANEPLSASHQAPDLSRFADFATWFDGLGATAEAQGASRSGPGRSEG